MTKQNEPIVRSLIDKGFIYDSYKTYEDDIEMFCLTDDAIDWVGIPKGWRDAISKPKTKHVTTYFKSVHGLVHLAFGDGVTIQAHETQIEIDMGHEAKSHQWFAEIWEIEQITKDEFFEVYHKAVQNQTEALLKL